MLDWTSRKKESCKKGCIAKPRCIHARTYNTLYSGFTGSQKVDCPAPLRQSSPGPISLELFGMEETQDEPLELPVQATITVQFTPVLSSAPADSRLPFTGEPP